MAINQNKPKTQPLVFVKKRHHSREILEIFLNEGNLCGKAFTEHVTLNRNSQECVQYYPYLGISQGALLKSNF